MEVKNLKRSTSCDFPAHIRNLDDVIQHQSVNEHCRQTAKYASETLSTMNLRSTGYLVGLLHDMGKYTKIFADYIKKAARGEEVARGSVNHTFASVIFLMERYHIKSKIDISMLTCEILAFAAGSHHGEFDCVDLNRDNGFEHRLDIDRESICYSEALKNFLTQCTSYEELDRLFHESTQEIESVFTTFKGIYGTGVTSVSFAVGMLARLILSSLIDADRRDTAEFMLNKEFSAVPADEALWSKVTGHMESKIASFKADTAINKSRAYFSDTCSQKGAIQQYGVYRMTLPTGAGKTISSLRYALSNAKTYGKRRIIFVIPLLSILEQNSAVIRDYIGDYNIITEHHSNFIKDYNTKEELDDYELLTQTWNSPIIITTLVLMPSQSVPVLTELPVRR